MSSHDSFPQQTRIGWVQAALFVMAVQPFSIHAEESVALDHQITSLLSVDKEGQGNEEASAAWKRIAAVDAYSIPKILAAIDQAKPISANYIRSAVDAIAGRARQENSPLPTAELEAFLKTQSHAPHARRFAYELLIAVDPKAKERWVSTFLLDPSPELRRDSVEHWQSLAEKELAANAKDKAIDLFEKAFSGAVDEDQVTSLGKKLEDLGRPVDLPAHFGYIQNWKIIGPFDNTSEKGYDTVFPPEEKIDLAAKYPGKGKEVAWSDLTSTHQMAKVDLQKGIEKAKGVLGYGYSVFTAPEERDAQLRISTPNGWKVWLNGKFVFGKAEYHSGEFFDQTILDVHLNKGDNTILVKCCQNEQTEPWTNVWRFQVRVCDASGTAILASNRPKVQTIFEKED
jgi:hypothetical protein